jgi:glycosyltransferase involved in cell wall biosynthesis
MCTYNGAKFLQEQLDSIACQSRLPDELIIFDDGSSDTSISIIEKYVKNVSFTVHVHINKPNVGVIKNFEAAIKRCIGDLIVLADQDDVWKVEKLSCIEQVFWEFPNVGCVFSNADVTNSTLGTLGYDLWSVVGFTDNEQQKIATNKGFSILLRHNVVTGATMAFRANFREILLPIPIGWMHDEWIALILSAVTNIAAINKILISYRQHDNNQIGAVKKTVIAKSIKAQHRNFESEIQKYNDLLDRLVRPNIIKIDQSAISEIQKKISHLRVRLKLRGGLCKSFFFGLSELVCLRYKRYSNGSRSFFADVFFSESSTNDKD